MHEIQVYRQTQFQVLAELGTYLSLVTNVKRRNMSNEALSEELTHNITLYRASGHLPRRQWNQACDQLISNGDIQGLLWPVTHGEPRNVPCNDSVRGCTM